ncbi:MAG TPA: SCO family protein [Candidatus Solibacter sp.]|jgi:protein SCO1/2|nr:SCO family protein [Candidatus Solibacter sp.]
MKISLHFLCGAIFLLGVVFSVAQQQPAPQERPQAPASPALHYFTDVVLLDQNGEPKRLYSDLLKGKTIIANAFFTSCHDSCPIMAGRMAGIQDAVGDRLGKDVYILSFSVDPEDTPERLKAYGEKFKARPGWFFLTGTQENRESALHKFGLLPDQKENHLNIFIIGNEKTGLWKKARGTAPAQQIIEIVNSVMNDRG